MYNIKGYKALHPNDTARGGAAMVILKNLKILTKTIQGIGVEVYSKRYNFVVTAISSPSRHIIETEDCINFLRTYE